MASGRRATAPGSMSDWRMPTSWPRSTRSTNKVIATVPVGQAPQAIDYVPNAVPSRRWHGGLQPLASAGSVTHLHPRPQGRRSGQGGLTTEHRLAVRSRADPGPAGRGQRARAEEALPPRAREQARRSRGPRAPRAFMTNPAGSAIVNAVGPIRQIVKDGSPEVRRYLVVAPGTPDYPGAPVQVQAAQP